MVLKYMQKVRVITEVRLVESQLSTFTALYNHAQVSVMGYGCLK